MMRREGYTVALDGNENREEKKGTVMCAVLTKEDEINDPR